MDLKEFELTYTHSGITRKVILEGINFQQAEQEFAYYLRNKFQIEDYKRIKIIEIPKNSCII